MKTPICDFVKNYIEQKPLRLHMPGHKGCGLLGFEEFDITEIDGADSLYEADGIIKESEDNASKLFGSDTFYSTEGSSQCIRAMLFLAAQKSGENRLIAAGRNAHKVFITAAALLDLQIDWLIDGDNYLSCEITPAYLENYFKTADKMPFAVYVTSPDYLGNMLDIKGLKKVCGAYGVPLLVDNAHGGYLKFLNKSLHPIDLGADMCCDSAHKTLPVLTGGAYLHISHSADEYYKENAKNALAMFGSTSPSYLILQSLDMGNKYLENLGPELEKFVPKIDELKAKMTDMGYSFVGDEPLKITVNAKKYGYSGCELGKIISKSNLIPEFFDPDYLTLMLTPQIGDDGLDKILSTFLNIPKGNGEFLPSPKNVIPKRAVSVRKAAFSESENVDIEKAAGRVAALPTVGCPPAVPIVTCGEIIDQNVINSFKYYGIKKCAVIAEKT